jgi:hypothetical protein
MRPALVLVCFLAGGAGHSVPVCASLPEVVGVETRARVWQAPARLAQRQPGGLPGMSDAEEEGRPAPKGVPGGLPGRTRQADPPLTRSLQTPKPPSGPGAGQDAGEKSGQQAPRGQKKTRDGAN